MKENISRSVERNKDRVYVRYNGRKIHRSRAIWMKYRGEIPKGYVIHHINGNKSDDRIRNLECLSIEEHGLRHRKPNRKRIVFPSGAIKVVPNYRR